MTTPLHRARWLYAALMTASIAGLLLAGGANFELSVHNRASAGFLWRTVLAQPMGFVPAALQAGVVVLLHGLFFALVYTLGLAGRQRADHPQWPLRPPGSLLLTWFSACWLLLDLHNDRFPLSTWAHAIGPITDAPAATLLSVIAAGWLLWRLADAARALARSSRRLRLTIATGLVAILAGALLDAIGPLLPARDDGPPNLVVIGLDSMRRDLATQDAAAALVPALTRLRASAHVEANVVTPLPHTFPSWTTILTGRHPQQTGARYNLTARHSIDLDGSLAEKLRRVGYRTIYATDETRFSNIGENFGFEEVIAPQPGVSDFLLAQFLDQPLVNLFVQLPGAEWLLPALVANRAFAHAYRPQRFIDRLTAAIGPADGRPTFLAVHLCLAHWPFYSATPQPMVPGFPREPYFPAAHEADAQFDALRQRLQTLGYLDDTDTLEVVLSDHGEATFEDLHAMQPPTLHGATAKAPPMLGGHGTSLLVPEQWQVFTYFRGHSVRGPIAPGRSERLASLEDVAPTILALLGQPVPATTPRMAVADPEGRHPARRHVRMETGYTPEGFDAVNPDADKALRIAEASFDVQTDGRVEMKDWVYRETLPYKQLAVTDGRRVLTVTGRQHAPMLVVQDLQDRSTIVHDLAVPDPDAAPPLLDLACAEPELGSRLAGWCRRASPP